MTHTTHPRTINWPTFLSLSLESKTVSLMLYCLGLIFIWGYAVAGLPNFYLFISLYMCTFILNRPQKVLSPLSFFYAYYAIWYILAPLFGLRYAFVLGEEEFSLAFAMLYTTLGLGVLCIQYGELLGSKLTVPAPGKEWLTRISLPGLIFILYGLCTLWVALIIRVTGGLEHWISNPGLAFLNRGGSGVYVILSHFCSIILAGLSGYYAYTKKAYFYGFAFILWLAITSPVHGSKLQISLLFIVFCLPWLRSIKLFSAKTLVFGLVLTSIFFLGLYSRHLKWTSLEMLTYFLNYFSALENLALSLKDFDPNFLTTFFLPFVKFKTLFGLKDPSMYFDMNHMLTDYYYPSAWAMRVTEQWPVETDLYLNFYFFLGLPLLGLYLWFLGFMYGHAAKKETLGAWLASVLMTIFMISHLRGSLINHIDFYMYPYIIGLYFMFNHLSLGKQQDSMKAGALYGVI